MLGNVHGRTFAVLVVICAAYAVVAVELPPQWKEYLNTVVSRSAESSLGVIIPPLSPHGLLPHDQPEWSCDDFAGYILPYVLLWNPLQQFHLVCVHGHCKSPLVLKCWKLGQANSLQPRLLHTAEHTVILVSTLYVCPAGHEVSSTDPRLMEYVGIHNIPFILLNKTGFMRNFVHTVVELVQQGMTLCGVERFIQQMRQHNALSIALQLHMALQSKYSGCCPPNLLSCIEASEAMRLIKKPLPSNDILAKCFLVDYFQNKDIYNLHMSQIPVKKFLTLDHTFKVASNIGYVRSDGKWVTLYNSVFIAMNEIGQIVAWIFTRTTSIDEVRPLLENLCDRLKETWSPPHHIFVDNCCSQRPKLKEIFGPQTEVSLDIFHATQRITRKLSKRHPFYSQCLNDLKLVWRSPTDLGKKRKEVTPAPDIMINSLDTFHEKWADCESDGWKLITAKTAKEISSLKVHITKGCLSHIDPGSGTNRNEALHRHVNPHFANKCRIGLPLALALLTILLYKHNCRIEEKITGNPALPIALWKYQHRDSIQHPIPEFGIQKKDPQLQRTTWTCSAIADISSIAFDPSSLEKESVNVSLSEESSQLMTLEDAVTIMEDALNLSKVALTMQKILPGSLVFDYRMLPLCSSVAAIFFDPQHNASDTHAQHEDRLENILKAWGMQRHKMAGDGNCCFSAVAFSVITNFSLLKEHASDFFESINLQVDPISNLDDVAMQLRGLCVREWKANPHEYEGFVPNTDVAAEADKFMESGFFYGELGNTMILSLSNALGLPLIIFSSAIYHPLINITPRHLRASIPLYLAFNQYGAGHYDGVTLSSTSSRPHSVTSSIQSAQCSCGKNDKSDKTHCQPQVMKYTSVTRCQCYKEQKACTPFCKCKNCSNPFGNNLPASNAMPSRKRPRQQWQCTVPKSALFAVNAMQEVPMGTRSTLEFFALECSLKYCIKERIDATSHNLQIVYNTSAELFDTFDEKLPIATKSEEEVEKFLVEHEHIVNVFKSLCLAQIRAQLE